MLGESLRITFQTEGTVVQIQEVEATAEADAKPGRVVRVEWWVDRCLGYRNVPPLSFPVELGRKLKSALCLAAL